MRNGKNCSIDSVLQMKKKTIQKVVEDWKKELPEATIYVYNNNSTDRTVEIAKEAGAIVRNEYQQEKEM